MMGLDNAGKSTALFRMKTGQYCETIPTIGFNCEKIRGKTHRTKDVFYTIWDVGGQERVRPLWRTYAKSTQGILFVVDSADRDTLEEAKIELEQIIKYTESQMLPIIILANKQDLPNAVELGQLKSYLLKDTRVELVKAKTNFMAQHHFENPLARCVRSIEVLSVCAITGEGLDEALELVFDLVTNKKPKNGTSSSNSDNNNKHANTNDSENKVAGGVSASASSASSSSASNHNTSQPASRLKFFN
jgi:ADP-ribosylation factor-like protein 4